MSFHRIVGHGQSGMIPSTSLDDTTKSKYMEKLK